MPDEPAPIRRYPERVTTDQLKRRCSEWKPKWEIVLVGERAYRKDPDGWWYLISDRPYGEDPTTP